MALSISVLDVSGPLLALFGVLYEAPFSIYIMNQKIYIINQKKQRFQDRQRHQNTPFKWI